MEINIDPNSGCCNGVIRAIEQVEKYLAHNPSLYSLGAIVHNEAEIDRLSKKGLKITTGEEFQILKNTTVLVRAHGEPPATYEIAKKNHITIIDCTCPVVLKLQRKIAETYEQIHKNSGQVIIFGENGHAEVNGLVGQIGGNALIIESKNDLDELITSYQINLTNPIAIFSQTTKDPNHYYSLCEHLKSQIIAKIGNASSLSIFDSICRQVSSRYPNLIEFAKNHSIIIFVSGKESSNGKALFQLCKTNNPRSQMIGHHTELDPSWFSPDDTVGICGATSTPKWQLEEVAEAIRRLILTAVKNSF